MRRGKTEAAGYEAGQDWAANRATRGQLNRLAKFELLNYADPLAEVVARTIDHWRNGRDAWDFWGNELGDDDRLAENDLFVRGFVDGALVDGGESK